MLQIYSAGTVAANKDPGSAFVEVTPIEDLPMLDGEITDNATAYMVESEDSQGVATTVDAPTAATIRCEWMALGEPNRMTPPDVRRGHPVIIYRFADTDKYYWVSWVSDLKFRKLETVVFAISATSEEDITPDNSNSYVFEMSSHKKYIRIMTSQANGEPFGYNIELNTGEGFFKIIDTAMNQILIDSRENTIRLENGNGSFFDMTKDMINMMTAESIAIKTKAFSADTETWDVEASSAASLTTPDNTITAATTHDGNILLMGNLDTAPGSGGGGSGSFSGGMRIEEDLEVGSNAGFSGVVHVQKLISEQDIDAPNV